MLSIFLNKRNKREKFFQKRRWKYVLLFIILVITISLIKAIEKAPVITTQKIEQEINEENFNWATYSNLFYNVEFKYPSEWKLKKEISLAHRYEGKDGFFQILALSKKGLSVEEICKNEVFQKLKPYGSSPKIKILEISHRKGCLILPSDDQPKSMKNGAILILRYRWPISILGEDYNYFVLGGDKSHIEKIVKTLKFIKN